ncbi:deaminase [Pseudomonas sp. GX19020]|uniref:anti-phage dCTP deaminase n=1 Tax=Pseudomonas sp. GX19020 TaxID=2942277 RepID=UPI002018ECA2|nr:anti-phage dCTP deaminase [Pseudomonas sp. GX19020]MCL4069281.1 deaminase [Pseudomonas sp. GX19020]
MALAVIGGAVNEGTAENGVLLANDIDERLSQELVFALVGPVGSGCSTVAAELKKELEINYKYDVAPIISASEIIKATQRKLGLEVPVKSNITNYVDSMQKAGNGLRKKYGQDYIAKRIVEQIQRERKTIGGFDGNKVIPKRAAYIVDSIKNIDELKLLRKIYRETLIVIGTFAPEAQRSLRLRITPSEEKLVKILFSKDQGESESFGQATRKIFTKSDCFICNDSSLDLLKQKIQRMLRLCFNVGINTPTKAEAAMYKANAVAANSACLSRQVGATIVSERGEVIAVGWNDVPRFGGGLYDEDTRISNGKDERCYNWQGKGLCRNESTRNDILDAIVDRLSDANFVLKRTPKHAIRSHLAGSPIDALIEFSRSIHAEMEAILSVAREGKHSLVGATLYTNTYPCHNCARHIVASGIKKVVYIEPYLKSHAIKLHSDAITEDLTDAEQCQDKVFFQQFDGIAPQNYLKFFRPEGERKGDRGVITEERPSDALPVLRIALDAPLLYEDVIVASLLKLEKEE